MLGTIAAIARAPRVEKVRINKAERKIPQAQNIDVPADLPKVARRPAFEKRGLHLFAYEGARVFLVDQ